MGSPGKRLKINVEENLNFWRANRTFTKKQTYSKSKKFCRKIPEKGAQV
jgi:hypothetical protein